MKKIVTLMMISVFFCLPNGSAAEEETADVHVSQHHRHREYAKIKNPVAKTEASILEGGKLYEKHCMVCHGKAGKGGIGPDLSRRVLKHGSTDGEIFHIITSGAKGTAMKGFGDKLPDAMRWHLVNYVSSLKAKEGK